MQTEETSADWQRYLGPRGIPQALCTLSNGQAWLLPPLPGWAGRLPLPELARHADLRKRRNYRLFPDRHSLSLSRCSTFLCGASARLCSKLVNWSNRRGAGRTTSSKSRSITSPHALRRIVRALTKLDYPTDRLTIQLLIEDDDEDTKGAFEGVTLASQFKIVRIPVCEPRTKPKACNVGLAEAEGEFLVIFDAEDRPDPDQLKKAVIAFGQSSEKTGCIQAKLSFYNSRQNLLTRLFTADYALWFNLCLPALDYRNAPVPLGGTSNHFRLDILKEMQGWDEYNVTEDCDLGIRLAIAGWQTRIMDSTTWEEACPRFGAWTRQRSRWVKGYLQTYLVHMRSPLHMTRKLGLGRSLHVHLLIGGFSTHPVAQPRLLDHGAGLADRPCP